MNRAGYVYLIQMEGTDYHKIGVSARDPFERLAALQTSVPFKLELIDAFWQTESYQVENELHTAMAQYWVRGVWF